MKQISLFILLLSMLSILSSCEETIEAGNTLNEEERRYLAEQSAKKCKTDTAKGVADYKSISNEDMLDFERNDAWKWELKQTEGSSSSTTTSNIYVWKVSNTAVYLRIMEKSGETTTNKFVKISKTTNTEMVDALQGYACDKTIEKFSFSSTSASGTDKTARAQVDSETYVENERALRFKYSYPVYMGSLDKKVTKKSYANSTTSTVKATETFDYTITSIADADQTSSYTDYATRNYCVVKFTPPVPPETANTYPFPFDLTCVTDATGAGLTDFVPNTELVI